MKIVVLLVKFGWRRDRDEHLTLTCASMCMCAFFAASYVQAEETVSSQTVSVRESYTTENSRLERISGTKPFLFQYKQLHLELKYLPPWSHDQVLRYLRCSLMLTGMGKVLKKIITANQNPKAPNTLADEKEKQCTLQSHKNHTLAVGWVLIFTCQQVLYGKRPKEQIEFH